jgi:hypothetical protein
MASNDLSLFDKVVTLVISIYGSMVREVLGCEDGSITVN